MNNINFNECDATSEAVELSRLDLLPDIVLAQIFTLALYNDRMWTACVSNGRMYFINSVFEFLGMSPINCDFVRRFTTGERQEKINIEEPKELAFYSLVARRTIPRINSSEYYRIIDETRDLIRLSRVVIYAHEYMSILHSAMKICDFRVNPVFVCNSDGEELKTNIDLYYVDEKNRSPHLVFICYEHHIDYTAINERLIPRFRNAMNGVCRQTLFDEHIPRTNNVARMILYPRLNKLITIDNN